MIESENWHERAYPAVFAAGEKRRVQAVRWMRGHIGRALIELLVNQATGAAAAAAVCPRA